LIKENVISSFKKYAQLKVRKLRKIAREKRQAFLTRRVDFECGGDTQLAAKVRARILKAEDLKTVCTKIRHVVSPQQSAGLNSVLIPVDNADPKKATVWKKIDGPRAVVSIIQAGNKKHFRQSQKHTVHHWRIQGDPIQGHWPARRLDPCRNLPVSRPSSLDAS
jgi:hypothetical protein